jgi:hypothetical protein
MLVRTHERQKKLFRGRFLEVKEIPLTGMQTHTKEKNYTAKKDTGHGIPDTGVFAMLLLPTKG